MLKNTPLTNTTPSKEKGQKILEHHRPTEWVRIETMKPKFAPHTITQRTKRTITARKMKKPRDPARHMREGGPL
jgi:hypothetical protein